MVLLPLYLLTSSLLIVDIEGIRRTKKKPVKSTIIEGRLRCFDHIDAYLVWVLIVYLDDYEMYAHERYGPKGTDRVEIDYCLEELREDDFLGCLAYSLKGQPGTNWRLV